MTRVAHRFRYGGEVIRFDVVRRDRRTLQISVGPDMKVQAAAPQNASDGAILKRVHKRGQWIRRQLQYFTQFQPRTPNRLYVAGETHLYLGRRYRLKVVGDVQARVKVAAGFIQVHSHHPSRNELVRRQLEDWYRNRAHESFKRRLELCLARFPNPERFQPRGVIIRVLKKRWGSMTPAGRLVLNRSLLQASVHEIDYVITHELCHLAFHHHGKRFYELLDQVMPDWKQRKTSLERRLA
jgi:predicted metal-dependent hydrolase